MSTTQHSGATQRHAASDLTQFEWDFHDVLVVVHSGKRRSRAEEERGANGSSRDVGFVLDSVVISSQVWLGVDPGRFTTLLEGKLPTASTHAAVGASAPSLVVQQSECSGLQPGDVLLAIDSRSVEGCTVDETMAHLRKLPLSEGIMLRIARLKSLHLGGVKPKLHASMFDEDAVSVVSSVNTLSSQRKTSAPRTSRTSSTVKPAPTSRPRSASTSRAPSGAGGPSPIRASLTRKPSNASITSSASTPVARPFGGSSGAFLADSLHQPRGSASPSLGQFGKGAAPQAAQSQSRTGDGEVGALRRVRSASAPRARAVSAGTTSSSALTPLLPPRRVTGSAVGTPARTTTPVATGSLSTRRTSASGLSTPARRGSGTAASEPRSAGVRTSISTSRADVASASRLRSSGMHNPAAGRDPVLAAFLESGDSGDSGDVERTPAAADARRTNPDLELANLTSASARHFGSGPVSSKARAPASAGSARRPSSSSSDGAAAATTSDPQSLRLINALLERHASSSLTAGARKTQKLTGGSPKLAPATALRGTGVSLSLPGVSSQPEVRGRSLGTLGAEASSSRAPRSHSASTSTNSSRAGGVAGAAAASMSRGSGGVGPLPRSNVGSGTPTLTPNVGNPHVSEAKPSSYSSSASASSVTQSQRSLPTALPQPSVELKPRRLSTEAPSAAPGVVAPARPASTSMPIRSASTSRLPSSRLPVLSARLGAPQAQSGVASSVLSTGVASGLLSVRPSDRAGSGGGLGGSGSRVGGTPVSVLSRSRTVSPSPAISTPRTAPKAGLLSGASTPTGTGRSLRPVSLTTTPRHLPPPSPAAVGRPSSQVMTPLQAVGSERTLAGDATPNPRSGGAKGTPSQSTRRLLSSGTPPPVAPPTSGGQLAGLGGTPIRSIRGGGRSASSTSLRAGSVASSEHPAGGGKAAVTPPSGSSSLSAAALVPTGTHTPRSTSSQRLLQVLSSPSPTPVSSTPPASGVGLVRTGTRQLQHESTCNDTGGASSGSSTRTSESGTRPSPAADAIGASAVAAAAASMVGRNGPSAAPPTGGPTFAASAAAKLRGALAELEVALADLETGGV